MKKRLLFIVNPRSGITNLRGLPQLINTYFEKQVFDVEIRETRKSGDASEWSQHASGEKFDAIIAVGGDGTVNECASGVVESQTALGIIPSGSGNGFARHLGIAPHDITNALKTIAAGKTMFVDTARLNGKLFLSNAGCGFVAEVAGSFAKGPKKWMRGFTGYAWFTLQRFGFFKEQYVTIIADGINYSGTYFAVNICNASQFGYGARIAPAADLQDGMLELVLIHKQPKWKYPLMLYPLFRSNIHNTPGVQTILCSHVELRMDATAQFQIDGEPLWISNNVQASVLPRTLKVIVP